MTLLIVADVTLRYVFNQPLAYSLEVVELALSVVVFFGIVMCTARQGHVAIDIVVTRFSPRVKAAINSFVYFLSTGIFGVLAWRLFVQGINIQQAGKMTPILKIPQYPLILVFALCSVLVALLFLSQLVHFIRRALSE
jgi:TRAP-type C4-dicarboxylate transport system permease small subunit